MHSRRAQNFLAVLFAALAVVAAPASRADALDGVLEVRSAYVSVEQGALQLFARVAYPVNDDIRAALKDGLTLTFDLDVVVSRERRFWMDETVCGVSAEARAQLSRGQRPLPDARRRSAQSGEQHSYATPRGSARGARHGGRLAVLLTPRSCRRIAQYRVSLRAGVRRGRLLGYACA